MIERLKDRENPLGSAITAISNIKLSPFSTTITVGDAQKFKFPTLLPSLYTRWNVVGASEKKKQTSHENDEHTVTTVQILTARK